MNIATGAHGHGRLASIGLGKVRGGLNVFEYQRDCSGVLKVNGLGVTLGSHLLIAEGKWSRTASLSGPRGEDCVRCRETAYKHGKEKHNSVPPQWNLPPAEFGTCTAHVHLMP
jgi:hypothetical protein